MRRTLPRAGAMLFALALTASFTLAHAATASARGWLGVVTQEINSDLREGLNLPDDSGVLVNRVVENSPADKAGLRQGDVILRFNLRDVESPADLQSMVGDAREGQEVALRIQRNGEAKTLSVTLGSRPENPEAMSAPEAPEPPDAPEAPAPPNASDDHGKQKIHVKIQRDGDTPKVYTWEGDSNDMPDHVREMLPKMKMRELHGMQGWTACRAWTAWAHSHDDGRPWPPRRARPDAERRPRLGARRARQGRRAGARGGGRHPRRARRPAGR